MPAKAKFPGTVVSPTNNFPAGQYQFVVTIPSNISTAAFILDRNTWPNTGSDVVTLSIDLSSDNGVTWNFFGGFTASGGDIINFKGETLSQSFAQFAIDPSMWGQKARITFTLAVTLNTQVSLFTQ